MTADPAQNILQLAFAAFQKKDAAETERLCRQVLASEPHQLQAMQMLAEVLAFTNRSTEATALFRQIVQLMQKALSTITIHHGLNTLRSLGWQPSGILDIGAYHGGWALMARHFFPQSFIVMVEAQPKLEAILKSVASSHPGIDFRSVLLGPERRELVDFFQMDIAISTGSSLYAEQTSFARSIIKLPMVTLDDVVSEFHGQKFALLKLDVQGAELDILKGATSTLIDVEVVVIELSLVEYNKGAPLIADVTAALNDLGFLMFDVYPLTRDRAERLLQADAIFVRRGSQLLAKPPFY